MTQTMLEKMARAMLVQGISSQPDEELLKGMRYENRAQYVDAFWDTQIPKARAALQALREPTEEVVKAISAAIIYFANTIPLDRNRSR